jgi:hypothetical protein
MLMSHAVLALAAVSCCATGAPAAAPQTAASSTRRLAAEEAATRLTGKPLSHARHTKPPLPEYFAPTPDCPVELARQVNATGLLPVDMFGDPNATDDHRVRLAINASRVCGGAIFFVSTPNRIAYQFVTTVDVPANIVFQGGGWNGVAEFQTPSMAEIGGPMHGPVFSVVSAQRVHFLNLRILNRETAVYITDSALVSFENVAMQATTIATGADDVNTTAEGCDACNIVYGSNNTALVVENSFWVWLVDSSFTFLPMYGPATDPPDPGRAKDTDGSWGQRPSVIIRGNSPGKVFGIDTVYLLHVERVVFAGGAVQYQQVTTSQQWPGFFDFVACTTEYSATPLLDFQAKPGVGFVAGLQEVTIIDFSGADVRMPNYLRGYPVLHELASGCPNVAPPPPDCRSPVPLVALNCSGNTGCELDGLTIMGSSGYEGSNGPRTAVRIYDGTATAVTVIDGGRTGSGDVRDANDLPAGSWLSRSSGGWVIVGDAAAPPPTDARMGVRGAAAEAHAVLIGQSGEANARLGIGSDGAIRWRSANSTAKGFSTCLLGRLSANMTYDAPSIKPGGWVKTTLALEEAQPGDVVDATLSTLGEAAVFLSARVSSLGVVTIFLKNEEETAVDLEPVHN